MAAGSPASAWASTVPASPGSSSPIASAPMAIPPLQTRFQLWVARVQNARAVYACSAGRSPFSTMARRIVARSSGLRVSYSQS